MIYYFLYLNLPSHSAETIVLQAKSLLIIVTGLNFLSRSRPVTEIRDDFLSALHHNLMSRAIIPPYFFAPPNFITFLSLLFPPYRLSQSRYHRCSHRCWPRFSSRRRLLPLKRTRNSSRSDRSETLYHPLRRRSRRH